MPTMMHQSVIDAPAEAVFEWHARPGALERLTPPWEPLRIVGRYGPGLMDGGRVHMVVGRRPLAFPWIALHDGYVYGRQFGDRQLCGPFHEWTHLCRSTADGPDRCLYQDEVHYVLPTGRLAEAVLGSYVSRRLARMFDYRHETLRGDLLRHATFPGMGPLRVVITGATGLIGTRLGHFLTTGGHTVVRLSRRRTGQPNEAHWDPARGEIDAFALAGADAVVHLAGENVAARWTAERKRRLVDSRVQSTRLLCETLARMSRPPRVLVAASAIGFYGDRGEESVDEGSPSGAGFLAELCRQWEGAAAPAVAAGIRVVHLRIGVVLSGGGGTLPVIAFPFRFGLGGRLGSGRQYFSWIDMDDLLGAIHFALGCESLAGPVNASAPEPATNREFTHALARVLHRPVGPPVPGGVLRLLVGEMVESILGGARVRPARLAAAGFRFLQPTVEAALRRQLGRA